MESTAGGVVVEEDDAAEEEAIEVVEDNDRMEVVAEATLIRNEDNITVKAADGRR